MAKWWPRRDNYRWFFFSCFFPFSLLSKICKTSINYYTLVIIKKNLGWSSSFLLPSLPISFCVCLFLKHMPWQRRFLIGEGGHGPNTRLYPGWSPCLGRLSPPPQGGLIPKKQPWPRCFWEAALTSLKPKQWSHDHVALQQRLLGGQQPGFIYLVTPKSQANVWNLLFDESNGGESW